MASYYESYSRDRDRDREWDRDLIYSDDEDERRTKTTVRRYKVGPERDHAERVDRIDRTITRRNSSPSYAINSVYSREDRRDYGPEPPRSPFDVSDVTRRTERERDYYSSGLGGRVVYEKTSEIERERERPRETYARLPRRGDRDDIVVESISINEDHRDDGRGGEVQRWHRETEYFEPASSASQPIVIRNRAPEQKIIFQEAPAPAPVIVPQAQPGVIVIRDNDRHHDARDKESEDYLYERRQRRESGRESDMAMERFERRDDRPHRHRHRHHHHHHRYASDGDYSDDGGSDYYVKRTTIIRGERSPSRHRKHLAEGALAGAGLGALMGSRRNGQTGDLPEHRGRKVLAGAALGAIGTEVLKRAHSAYNDRYGDERDDGDLARSRSRSRSAGRHSKLKTGLGLAAAALAVAGAAKYMQSGRIDREERNRGRSRHRYSDDEDDASGSYPSRSASRPARSRSRSVAKVAAGTAAVAGLVHHLRSKSRQRDGKKARSHSRIRTGAEIAAAGLAGAAAKKIYDKHRDKKSAQERDRQVDDSDEYGGDHDDDDDDDNHGRGRHSGRHSTRSVSGSRSRSRSAHPRSGSARAPYPPSTADDDAELGMVEYGSRPLYSDAHARDGRQPATTYDDSVAGASAADAVDQDDRRRRHRRRSRHGEADVASVYGDDGDYADVSNGEQDAKRTRSRSRLRNLAAAGAGAAAAAIGIKKYGDKKKRDQEAADNRDDGSVYNDDLDRDDDRDHERDRHGSRDRHHRVTEEALDDYRRHSKHHGRRNDADGYGGPFYDSDISRPPSPTHASGGAYYPPVPPMDVGAGVGVSPGLMQHANTNIHDAYVPYRPFVPDTYPPPPGPPPSQKQRGADDYPPPPIGLPSQQQHDADIYPPPPGPPPSQQQRGPETYPPPPGPPPSQQQRGADVPYSGPASPGPIPQGPPPPPVAPQPAAALDPTRNAPSQPSHGDDHVSAPLPLARGSAASAAATLPPRSQTSKEPVDASSLASSAWEDAQETAPKNVGFAPLSPKSSRTMLRHHAETGQSLAGVLDKSSAGKLPLALPAPDTDDMDEGRDVDDSDSEVEVLPDRFDSHGRSLSEGQASASRSGGRIRTGNFEYESPRHGDGWHVHGQWGVASTDGVDVDRIASRITESLDGMGSGRGALPVVLGLIGDVLGGLASGSQGHRRIEDRRGTTTPTDDEAEKKKHYHSSDDDRKRKRGGSTYDTARRKKDTRSRPWHGDRRQRASSSPERITGGYFFDRDGYDGQEVRKRRRSWAS